MRAGPWNDEETKMLLADNEVGTSRWETASKLGRGLESVYKKAEGLGLAREVPGGEDAALRARWARMLPRLKEDLRREINI